MFSINDTVMYSTVGVCRVEGVSALALGRESKDYYVLRPLSNGGSTVYIPVDNEQLLSKVRKVITRDELSDLLSCDIAAEWIDDSTARSAAYSDIIKSGDRSRIIGIILTLTNRRRSLSGTGRKLRISDERALRDCERIIGDEVAYVLGISTEKAIDYIKDNVNSL